MPRLDKVYRVGHGSLLAATGKVGPPPRIRSQAPRRSSFAGEAGRQLLGDGAGVVGVTCVPNLLAGGWKALRLGLPPQCVLLDHCGCRKHWHDEGISTDLDEAELRRVFALA